MAHVFVSYARADVEVARQVASTLLASGWSVFLDTSTPVGSRWSNTIRQELDSAECVLVLWTANSRRSFWVVGEAARAYERGVLLQVSIGEQVPPKLFAADQSLSIGSPTSPNSLAASGLTEQVARIIGRPPGAQNLESVTPEQAVDRRHLHLIHTAWRSQSRHDLPSVTHRIRFMLFGHPTVLDRVSLVTYLLPGYPAASREVTYGPDARQSCFMHDELANGWCTLQALVRISGQPEGAEDVLQLYRLVNLMETGPRLEPYVNLAKPSATTSD